MQVYNFDQHSEDWYNIRLGKLTASHAKEISVGGAGLETLCFNLVGEILTKKKKETYQSAAMARGNELEDQARTLFELQTGLDVEQVGFVEEDDLCGCSPDGFIEGRTSGIEIKCPEDNTFAKYLFDGVIKPEYYAQMQMQMMLCNADHWFYVVFNPDFDEQIIIKRVEADAEFQDKLRKGIEKGKARIREILAQIENNLKGGNHEAN
ncbi:YqaJ viral recombinase family protein [bacterium]|nr:YqaJ viral recombinase family protein [bacterium]